MILGPTRGTRRGVYCFISTPDRLVYANAGVVYFHSFPSLMVAEPMPSPLGFLLPLTFALAMVLTLLNKTCHRMRALFHADVSTF